MLDGVNPGGACLRGFPGTPPGYPCLTLIGPITRVPTLWRLDPGVKEDRNPRDSTGCIAKSATIPGEFLRRDHTFSPPE